MTFFMIMFGMRCVCSSSIPVKGEVALPKLNQASIVARSYVLPSAEVVSRWPVSDAMAWRRHWNQKLLASGTIVVNGRVVSGSAFSLQDYASWQHLFCAYMYVPQTTGFVISSNEIGSR